MAKVYTYTLRQGKLLGNIVLPITTLLGPSLSPISKGGVTAVKIAALIFLNYPGTL